MAEAVLATAWCTDESSYNMHLYMACFCASASVITPSFAQIAVFSSYIFIRSKDISYQCVS